MKFTRKSKRTGLGELEAKRRMESEWDEVSRLFPSLHRLYSHQEWNEGDMGGRRKTSRLRLATRFERDRFLDSLHLLEQSDR